MVKRGTEGKMLSWTWIQICWGFSLLLLVLCSIMAYLHKGEEVVEVSVYLGLSMLIVGSINIIVYHKRKNVIHGSHWLLADGLSTVLLSVFPVFSQMMQPSIVPLFFGIWELFSGVLKEIDAKDLKEENVNGWKWFFGIGCFEVLSGVASLLKPVDDLLRINVVVSIIFFVQGCGYLFKILMYPRLLKRDNLAIKNS